jgi:hypothetical protein
MSTDYPTAIDSFDTHVDNVDDVMAADVNDLNDAVVATQTALAVAGWSTWTPTVTQSGAVAATVTRARYKIINKLCHVEVSLAVTAAGTAANDIVIAGQPAAMQPAYPYATNGFPIGVALITDTGTAYYSGILLALTTTDFRVTDPSTNQNIGTNPNFALANGDFIFFTATYEVA